MYLGNGTLNCSGTTSPTATNSVVPPTRTNTPVPSNTPSVPTNTPAPTKTTTPLSTTTSSLPDLVVTSITYAGSAIACQNQPRAQVVVTNNGSASSGSFIVQLNGGATQTVSGLTAGQSATVYFNLVTPATAVADATNLITESNESNNSLTAQLPVPSQAPTCTPTGNVVTPTKTMTSTATATCNCAGTNTPTRTSTPTATTTTGTGGALKVQYRVADPAAPGDNQIKPHFNIVNMGTTTINMSELKLRYYFTKDAGVSTFSAWCDYAVKSCANISVIVAALNPATATADYYIEVSFTAGAGSIATGQSSGEIQTRINKTDWSNFTETGDYSYDATKTTFTDWTRVALFRNGTLVWGTTP
jgi:hypothetical protein